MLIPNVPMAQYVADAFDGPPSLNSGLAHLLLTRSPAHAWWNHPRLRPGWQPDDDRGYDLGSAAHAVLLEGRELCVVDFPDYRTVQARNVRDAAKADGKLPVLAHQASDVAAMVTVARTAIATSPDLAGLGEMLAEQTILWEQDGVRLRCRPDWIADKVVISYKTTRASAEPNAFLRTILGSGYALQAAFELAGLRAIGREARHYVYVVQEVEEPFAVSLVGLSPEFHAFAEQAMRKAVSVWAECVARNQWPSYSERVCYLSLPPWTEAQFIDRHGPPPTGACVVDDGSPLADQLFGAEA